MKICRWAFISLEASECIYDGDKDISELNACDEENCPAYEEASNESKG